MSQNTSKRLTAIFAGILLAIGSVGAAYAARCTITQEDGSKIVLEGSSCETTASGCKCTD